MKKKKKVQKKAKKVAEKKKRKLKGGYCETPPQPIDNLSLIIKKDSFKIG